MDQTESKIGGMFLDTVRDYGSHTAVITADGSFSYRELHNRVIRAAATLYAAGVRKGDRVAVWLPNGVEWIELGLAIPLLGAITVPVGTRLKGGEIAFMLRKVRPAAVVAIGEFLGVDYAHTLDGEDLPPIKTWFRVGPGDPRWTDWAEATAGVDMSLEPAILEMAAAVRPGDVAEIMFTSGTTGLPKGAMLGHGQIVRVFTFQARRMQLHENDRQLIIAPMFHSFGFKVGVISSVAAGTAMYPMATFDAAKLLETIEKARITFLGAPPTVFIALLEENKKAHRDISSMYNVTTGGNNIPPSLIRELQTTASVKIIVTGYGLTEATALVCLGRPEDEPEIMANTVGSPLDGVEVKCVDGEGRPVPLGEPGEILVRGYNVMLGYFEDPEATRKVITEDGWLKTGDVGVLDERGYLRITDRIKDMYINGGFNCYPAEIERVMQGHPAVREVAVIGIPDPLMGEVGKAFVVLRAGARFDRDEFIAWCRQKMANYKVPRQVEVIGELPRNSMGKIQKFLLRHMTAKDDTKQEARDESRAD